MKKILLHLIFVVLFSSGSHLLSAQDALPKKISFGINSQLRVRSLNSESSLAYAVGPLIKLNNICSAGWDIEGGILFSHSRFEDTREGLFCGTGLEPYPIKTVDYQYLEFPLVARYCPSKNRQSKTRFALDLGLQSAILFGGIDKRYEPNDSNDEFTEISKKTYSIFYGYEKLNAPRSYFGFIFGAGIVTNIKKFSFHLAARFQSPAILKAESAQPYNMSNAGITFSAYY